MNAKIVCVLCVVVVMAALRGERAVRNQRTLARARTEQMSGVLNAKRVIAYTPRTHTHRLHCRLSYVFTHIRMRVSAYLKMYMNMQRLVDDLRLSQAAR